MTDEQNILNLPTEETAVATKEVLNNTKTTLDTTNSTLNTKLESIVTALTGIKSGVTSVNGKSGVVVLNKGDLDLDNVNNTSDLNKPISTATQAALNNKVDKTTTSNIVYGTDASGNQTTYNKDFFGQVDDVKVNNVSVVSNKVANIDISGKEDISNKITSISDNSTDIQYPSAKAVFTKYNENKERIDILESRGRFLSNWNCDAGLPATNPPTIPYTYRAGDYYIIGVFTADVAHYKPNGYTYTGAASETAETRTDLQVGDVYIYDGATWIVQKNTQKEITIANVVGLQTELDNKATTTALSSHTTDKTNPHGVTKAQVGLDKVDNTADINKPISTATQTALDAKVDKVTGSQLIESSKVAAYDSHLTNTNNPHAVSKVQVGLGNADNTSDLNKPISTATQAALDLKANEQTVSEHISNTSNPHGVTKAQVGLDNVDNTSDANKPISTATQAALSEKQATLVSGTNIKTINSESILGSGDIEITDTTYTAGNGIEISDENEISIDTDVVATQNDLAGKQDAISDLATIRSGASLGATAVQPEPGKGLFSGNYADLNGIPTKTSNFINDGDGTNPFLTQHQSLAAYRTSADQDVIDQNIREVAEGKCKTFILSYMDTAVDAANYANYYYFNSDGEQVAFTSENEMTTWIGINTNKNVDFNSQNAMIGPISPISTGGYIVFKGPYVPAINTYLLIKYADILTNMKTGDIVLVIETDVPDRWVRNYGFFKLETSKVDLGWSQIGTVSDPKPTTLSGYGITDAYTKTETNGLFYTKEQSQNIFSKIVDTRNLVFENISLENAYLSSIITKQEIMDGSGVGNWGFEGLSTSISENKSNKWFILFKVKSPVYTQAISWANIGITEYKNSTHWTQFGLSRSGQLGQNVKGDTKNPWSCESRSGQPISGLDPNEFYMSMYKNDTTYIIKLYDKNGNIVFNQTYTNDDLFLDAVSQGSETVPIISSRFVGFDIGQAVFKKGQDADLLSAIDNINVLLKYSTTFTFTSWFSNSSFNSLNYVYSKVVTQNELDGKQDTISDLSTIRSGASAGSTAVQPSAMNSKDFIQENAGHKFVVEHGNEFNMYKDGAEYCWLNYRGNMKELKVGDGSGSGTLGQITCKTIKLGNTILTESQLIALLNLLN